MANWFIPFSNGGRDIIGSNGPFAARHDEKTRRRQVMGQVNYAVNVREIVPGDADEWLRMRLALWPAPIGEHRIEMKLWLDGPMPTCTFVADAGDGRLVGFAEACMKHQVHRMQWRNVGFMEGWYVDPDCRRRGIGRQLASAIEQWTLAQGGSRLLSGAELDNQVSRQAHAALGFETEDQTVQFSKDLR